MQVSGALLLSRLGAIGALLLSEIIVARSLSTEDYGAYQIVGSLVAMAVLVGNFGWSSAAVRYLSEYRRKSDWFQYRRFEMASCRRVIGSACLASVGVVLIGVTVYRHSFGELYGLLVLAGTGVWICCQSAAQLIDGWLQALGRILSGQIPTGFVRRAVVLVGVALMAVLKKMSLVSVVSWETLTAVGILGIVLLLYRRRRPAELENGVAVGVKSFDRIQARWGDTAVQLGLGGLVAVGFFRVDNLLVGAFGSSSEVAVYAVGSRLASMIALILSVVEVALAPTVAAAFAGRSLGDVESKVRRLCTVSTAAAMVAGCLLIVFRRPLLLLFGTGYVRAATVTTVLAVCEVAIVAAGPARMVLAMTGEERWLVISGLTWLAINVASICLVMALGIGLDVVAVATGGSLIGWNVTCAWRSAHECGVRTTATFQLR